MDKLDNLDKKILYYLATNCRMPLNQISKKVRSSPAAVHYRIQRLENSGVITQYGIEIVPSALGMSMYRLYLDLARMPSKVQDALEADLLSYKQTLFVAKTSGEWDLYILLLIKENTMLLPIFDLIELKYQQYIRRKSIGLIRNSIRYPLNYLISQPITSEKNIDYIVEKNNITQKELNLLRVLYENARLPVIELAAKSGLSVKTVVQYLKSFFSQEIIAHYRTSLNLKQIGHMQKRILLNVINMDEKTLPRLMEFSRINPYVFRVQKVIGTYSFEIDMHVDSQEAFYKILDEFKKDFHEIIDEYYVLDIIFMTRNKKCPW